MSYFSYHTHSCYCDGKEEPEVYVEKAIEQGCRALGFASHAPLSIEPVWAMKEEKIEDYVREIDLLKQQYKDRIEIYRALEIDYIPGISRNFEEWKSIANLDYTIGSVHLVKAESEMDFWFLDGPDINYHRGLNDLFGGDIQKAVSSYYHQVVEMIQTQDPDVIGHVDKVKMNNKGRYFSEQDAWYQDLVNKTLDVIQKNSSIVEVNTRGIYKGKSKDLFPDGYFLNECCRRKIPVTISTDAHHPNELLSYFDETKKRLEAIGFRSIQIFENQKWVEERI